MDEICDACGLPKSICVCSEIGKEKQKIKIRVLKARFNKLITTVNGLEDKEKAKELGKMLKKKLACGGTVKGNEIELQGEHRKRVKEFLIQQGFKEELIEGA